MKNLKKILNPILIVFFMVAVLSCKNNKSEQKEELTEIKEMDSTSLSFMPFKIIAIKHKVADYTKWRMAYDAHDSIRKMYGITHFVIGRGMDDPNTIIIIDKIEDVMKAKEFSAMPSLKETMKKAGVISAPEFSFYDVIRNDDSKINLKDRLMVTHRVKDFDTWLKVYDAEGINKRMEDGLIDRGMARSIDDPNVVSLVFAISDLEKAKARINSEAMKNLMMEAGVEGQPQLFFYKLVD